MCGLEVVAPRKGEKKVRHSHAVKKEVFMHVSQKTSATSSSHGDDDKVDGLVALHPAQVSLSS